VEEIETQEPKENIEHLVSMEQEIGKNDSIKKDKKERTNEDANEKAVERRRGRQKAKR